MKEKLSSDVLLKRVSLPEKPTEVRLEGRYVILKPLDVQADAKPLYDVSCGKQITLGSKSHAAYDEDVLIWRYMFEGPFDTLEDFTKSVLAQKNAHNGLCLTVFDKESGHQVGIVNFMNSMPSHLKIELGGIWYSPIAQRTYVNTESIYLLLQHAFTLGYRRIEWKCDSENLRSMKAAERLGFTFEGIQESHFIVKECNRDTAWFRMLDSEWPHVKKNLESHLK